MGEMKKLRTDKRGIFFTFIAIAIMALFLLVFTPQADISLQKDTKGLSTRITAIDNYINELQNGYIKIALKATTHKTMLSLAYYVNQTNFFFLVRMILRKHLTKQ